MEEYAMRYYVLLEQALRLENEDQLARIIASEYPTLTKQQKQKILDSYSMQDKPRHANIEKDRAQLRKLLNKKKYGRRQ